MGVSKVIYGNNTLIDLTSDTVTSKTLLTGKTAHNKAGNSVTGEYSRPLMIHGRVVKQIFCPTVSNSSSYACYDKEWVGFQPYLDIIPLAKSVDGACFRYGGKLFDEGPLDYECSFGMMRFTSGGSATNKSLLFQMPTTKYNGSIASTAIYGAEANVDYFYILIIKLNSRSFLMITMKDYPSGDYWKGTGFQFRILYDTGTAIALSGATGITSGWTDSATVTNAFRFYMQTLNRDNTQLGLMRFNEATNNDTGNYTTYQSLYNNYRVKSPATMGLRSTAWTTIYNNTAYSLQSEAVLPEVGNYLFYYTNTAYTAYAEYFMSNIMGDYYGAQVAAFSSCTNIRFDIGIGGFLNDEDYLYLQRISLSNGVVKAGYKVVIPFGKTTRTNMRPLETGKSSVTLFSLSSLANICEPVYRYRTDSNTKFRFAKFIDGMIIIGISILKDIHAIGNSKSSFTTVEDNLYAIGLYYNIESDSFQVVGAARAGSFANDNFLGYTKNTLIHVGDLFEHNSDDVYDTEYNFETGARTNRTYNDIRKNWEFDPFRQYVIEYRDATGGTEN